MSLDDVYKIILSSNIRRLMRENNISSVELSEKSGVSIAFFNALVNGRENPSLRIIAQIAQALNTPLPMLLDDTDMDIKTMESLAQQKLYEFPDELVWQGGVLNKYQAFQVRQWSKENKKTLLDK